MNNDWSYDVGFGLYLKLKNQLDNSKYKNLTWYPWSFDPPILWGLSQYIVIVVSLALAKDGLLGDEGNCVRYGIDLISKFGSSLGSATLNAADHTAWPLIDLAWHVYKPLSEIESSKIEIEGFIINHQILKDVKAIYKSIFES